MRLEFLTVCPHISSMLNPILRARVVNSVRFAGFNNVQHYANSVCRAIKEFKEYENPRYYNYKKPNKQERSYVPTLKKIKRPTKIHFTHKGRYNQENVRVLLISNLSVIWINGKRCKPKINDKRYPDTPFVMFVSDIFRLIGIGNVHKHLEEYTSIRKAAWSNRPL